MKQSLVSLSWNDNFVPYYDIRNVLGGLVLFAPKRSVEFRPKDLLFFIVRVL